MCVIEFHKKFRPQGATELSAMTDVSVRWFPMTSHQIFTGSRCWNWFSVVMCRLADTLLTKTIVSCEYLQKPWRKIWLRGWGRGGGFDSILPEVNVSVNVVNKQLSTPSILAVNHLCWFQLNAHNTLNTYIYHQLPPTCFGVCYTNFRQTIAFLAQ